MRRATIDDVPAIRLMMQAYWNDIGNGLTPDDAAGIEHLMPALSGEHGAAFIGDGLFASIVWCRTYFVEKQAFIQMFYIAPEHRRTGISRHLAAALMNAAAGAGCATIEASQISGANYSKLWHNLWYRFGLRQTGIMMEGRL